MSTGFSLSRRMAFLLAAAPICFLGVMAATPAAAGENYALIVADSDYPNLDQKYWLKGPKNDEVLVRDYLLNNAPVKFEPQNVTALGSGDGMELGTHKAILDSLAKIADETKPGDFVYLHFSGHGSQQPAKSDTTEADGRDEVFLSADTQMAPPDNPSFLPNVLTDDEVSAALKAIRKTGAFVWVVFDSCHSGTMTRGAPEGEDTADRKVDPADLGIPDSAFTMPPVTASDRAVPLAADTYADDDTSMGGLVAFFAAQTSETTQERGFDVRQPDGSTAKVPYGVFTYTIFSALAKNPGMTYRQLAQSVLASYAAENSLKPTPLFEGKLDAPVFGSQEAAVAEQWPTIVAGNGAITISAGQLHGLSVGSKLLLLPSPAASDDEAIGLMQVQAATQLRSTLVPSSDDTHQLIDSKAIPTGAYVRLAEVSYPFELTVAMPDTTDVDSSQMAAVRSAINSIIVDPHKALKVNFVDAGQPADVKLALLSNAQVAKLGGATAGGTDSTDTTPKLWLLPTTGEVSLDPARRPPSIAVPHSGSGSRTVVIDPEFNKALEDNLVTIFRATGLSRLTQASTFKPKDFSLSFGVQAAGSDKIEALQAEATPIIRPRDRLYVDFSNTSGKPIDINVLYVDHNYGITLVCQSHLAVGDHLFQPMADVDVSDQGSERLITVINESGKDLTDLSFLTQPGIAPASRGTGATGLLGMIADLGAGVPTRGPTLAATADSKTPRGAVLMLPVEVQAVTDAQAAAEIAVEDPRTPEGSCVG